LNRARDLQALLDSADQGEIASRVLCTVEMKKPQHQREDVTAAGDDVVKTGSLRGRWIDVDRPIVIAPIMIEQLVAIDGNGNVGRAEDIAFANVLKVDCRHGRY